MPPRPCVSYSLCTMVKRGVFPILVVVVVVVLLGVVESALGAPAQTRQPNVPQCLSEVDAPSRVVTDTLVQADHVFVIDVDGDGDNDLVGTGFATAVYWYENNEGENEGSSDNFGPPILVGMLDKIESVFGADMDGDGTMDLVCAASSPVDRVVWFANRAPGNGSVWEEKVILGSEGGTILATPWDVNADGDIDVVVFSNRVVWLENADGVGDTWVEHVVDSRIARAGLVADVDADGDPDIVVTFVASPVGGATAWEVVWFQNTDGLGLTWVERVVSVPKNEFWEYLVAADVDGSGSLDVLVGGPGSGISFFPNLDGMGMFGDAQEVTSAGLPVPSNVAAADVDGDGDIDVASASFSDDRVVWFRNLGDGASWSPPLVVSGLGDGPRWVALAKIDGDERVDVVAAIASESTLAWFRNGEEGAFYGLRQVVTSLPSFVYSVVAVDIDGDGDLDMASASTGDDTVAWYENLDGTGTFGSQQVVSFLSDGAFGLVAADIDGDGAVDLVAGSQNSGVVEWFRNLDGLGTFGPSRVISDTSQVFALFAVDMDGDGRIDVVSGDSSQNTLTWHGNVEDAGGEDGIVWVDHEISSNAGGVSCVVAADFDGDGDLDVVAGLLDLAFDTAVVYVENLGGPGGLTDTGTYISFNEGSPRWVVEGDLDGDQALDVVVGDDDGQVKWYRNTDGNATFGMAHELGTESFGAWSVSVVDVDGDGDMDVVSAQLQAGTVFWFENTDGTGTAFEAELVGVESGAVSVFPADIDGDGDIDIAYSARGADQVGWYPRRTRSAFHEYVPERYVHPREEPGVMRTCGRVLTSSVCLAESMARMSRCVQDTLVLPPAGEYGCREAGHIRVQRALRVEAGTFSCGGGVLFAVGVGDGYVGELDLVGMTITGTGAGSSSSTGVPGLRVEQSGARLRLLNATVSGGVSVAEPTLLGGGTGGCVLALAGGVVEVSGSVVANCTASISGGGIGVAGAGSRVEIQDSVVTGNSAEGGFGGGVFVDSGTVGIVANSVVTGNTAGTCGGGVGVGPGGSVEVVGSEVSNNEALFLGGGLWVDARAGKTSVNRTGVRGNKAAMGGGVAVAQEFAFASPTLPVSDIPAVEEVPDTGGMDWTLVLSDAVFEGNTAGSVGGVAFVCGARVDVVGHGSEWGMDNVAQGSTLEMRSGADAFVCGAETAEGSGTVVDPSVPEGLPWIRMDGGGSSMVFERLGSRVHGPPVALEWVEVPPVLVEAGGSVQGSFRMLDWLGTEVVYRTSVAEVRFDDGDGVLSGVAVPALVLDQRVAVLPVSSLSVVPGAVLPADVNVVLGVIQNADGLDVKVLEGTVEVTACGVGRGGVTENGVTSCAACAEGTQSDEVSLNGCVGLEPCPDNTQRLAGTSNGSSVECTCKPGFWTPEGVPKVACVECPVGGVCEGGVVRPVAGPGFYPEEGGSTLFLACPNTRSCVGNGVCAPGYRGRLCAQCDDGYYALRGSCFACNNGVNVGVTALLVLGAVGVCGGLVVFNLAEGVRYRFAAAVIGLNGLQIAGQYGRLELDWGAVGAVYFDVVGALNLNVELTSPECSLAKGVDAWAMKLVLTLVLPVFVGLGIVFVGCVVAGLVVGRVGWFGRKNGSQVKGAMVRAWFQGLVLLYLPLTGAAFSVFGCRKDEGGRWVLAADPVRSCYNSAWWSGLFPVGLVAVCVYALAIPVGVVFVLWRKKRRMDEVGFVLVFGFLVGRFGGRFWWYEAAVMGRKLVVVMCMTFFFTEEGKANGAVLALLGSWAHLALACPYRAPFHNGLAMVVLAATACVLYAGTWDEKTARRVGVVGGVVVNVLAIVVGNVVDVVRIVREEKEVEEGEFFREGVVSMDRDWDSTGAATPDENPSTISEGVELSLLDTRRREAQQAGIGVVGGHVEMEEETRKEMVMDSVVDGVDLVETQVTG